MRARLAVSGTAAAVAALVIVSFPGVASADLLPVPLPTATVPLPTGEVPIPTPGLPSPGVPTLPGPTLPPPPGGLPIPTPPGGGSGSDPSKPSKPGQSQRSKSFITPVKPMIAGRPEAAYLLDDESTPALLRASKQFLSADQAIADIVGQQQALLAAVANAQRVVDDYTGLSAEAESMRTQTVALHDREVTASRLLGATARNAYLGGGLGAGDGDAATRLTDLAARLGDTAARAELRLGTVTGRMTDLRREYDGYALDYYRALEKLADYRKRLDELNRRRAAALAAAGAARAGDIQQSSARQVISGQLGAQIKAASERLREAGKAVDGTAEFLRPGRGPVTSSYGPRFHPILRYTKLHTGTDFGRGDGTIYAADDGVVLFTVTNRAYGNMTVIDHGIIDGRSITTMYAHQARFLVKEGERVEKGQPIGIIGSTGFSTGPHLHFEVRDAGAVQDPMTWLQRGNR